MNDRMRKKHQSLKINRKLISFEFVEPQRSQYTRLAVKSADLAF